MNRKAITIARRGAVSILVALAALSPTQTAAAQESGTVRVHGRVLDVAGGAVAGAQVRAENTDTGAVTTATTDGNGEYELTLATGSYRFEASAEHFGLAVEERTIEGTQRLNFALDLASFAHSVTVIERPRKELLRVPGGIAEVTADIIDEVTYGNMEEVMALTPGVLARSRFGADEVQFNIRGSGLRNNFHMRGVNLLFNGRPYMDADGFGDFESLDLMATQKIEVWKGANALRFGGNQAGGAVNFVTPTGETAPDLQLRGDGGSFGLLKTQIASGQDFGKFDYFASFGTVDTDGYRDYSAQERRRFFSNFAWELDPDTDFRVDLIYAKVDEQLPGALTQEQYDQNPEQANPVNEANRWGRDYDFYHGALALDHRLSDTSVVAFSLHGHVRDVLHPIFQVLDQYQRTVGGDAAYRYAGERTQAMIGVSVNGGGNKEARYENVGGDRGALTADFETDVTNLGIYGEVQRNLGDEWLLTVGARWDDSERGFDDFFLDNGDQSDERTYSAFQPRIGAIWTPSPGTQVFANVSRSYEPPLLLELTSFGAFAGFLDLEAQDTLQYELGTRGATEAFSWEVSVFDWEVDDEIININVQPFPGAPFTIPSYRNAEQTRHFGVEVGAGVPFGDFDWNVSYTWSDFHYVDDPEYGDNDLPGAPPSVLYTELRWRSASGFWVAPNVDASLSSYYVDSANTTRNDAFTLLGLKAGYPLGAFELLLDAHNLTDEVYSGAVQVDNALGQFLEPGNGRSAYLGVTWRLE